MLCGKLNFKQEHVIVCSQVLELRARAKRNCVCISKIKACLQTKVDEDVILHVWKSGKKSSLLLKEVDENIWYRWTGQVHTRHVQTTYHFRS